MRHLMWSRRRASNAWPIRPIVTAILLSLLLIAAVNVVIFRVDSGAAPPTCTLSIDIGEAREVRATRAILFAGGESASEAVEYTSEYSLDGSHWEVAGGGTSNVGDFEGVVGSYAVTVEAHRLLSKSSYFGRVIVKNACTTVVKQFAFNTGPVVAPEIRGLEINQVEAFTAVGREYADYQADVESNGAATKYRFEIAEEETLKKIGEAAWAPASGTGTSGTISTGEDFREAMVHIIGLNAATRYSIRIVAENEPKAGESKTVQASTTFETAVVTPEANIEETTNVTSVSAHVEGAARPRGSEAHWHFEYTVDLGELEKNEDVHLGPEGTITAAEANEGFQKVGGELVGLSPATRYFVRFNVDNGHAPSATSEIESFETAGKPVVLTFLTHAFAPGTEDLRVLGSVEPHGLDAHFHFEYVAQEDFEASGWAKAVSTTERDAGTGPFLRLYPVEIVGEDLPGLEPGGTYHYRLVAGSALGVTDGEEQVLRVPSPAVAVNPVCPNESLRTGAASHLPDCRAYEMVTPSEKEGSMDNWAYSGNVSTPVLVGEDGEKAMVRAQFSRWGPNVDAANNTYFFTRQEGIGWKMTAATQQPEAAQNSYRPGLFSTDLGQLGLGVGYSSSVENASPRVELVAGPAGGPYTPVTSELRSGVLEWVAGSGDLKTMILNKAGKLYEWANSELRQIDSCPATIAHASDGGSPGGAVSADGSRVFFEAPSAPGCSGATHLFMRLGTSETIDLGAYRLLAANAAGSTLLVEQAGHPGHEYLSYDVEGKTAKLLFATGDEAPGLVVSRDMSTVYVNSREQLTQDSPPVSLSSEHAGGSPENTYRYDVAKEKLEFVVQASSGGYYVSADGRYLYWSANGAAGIFSETGQFGDIEEQTYRYDDVEKSVQCISCASSFNPAPKMMSNYIAEGVETTVDDKPEPVVASDDGNYVFFITAAELVPQDTDGELYAGTKNYFSEEHDFDYSPSSDVYEWRKNGVDGCSHVQGCLALISSGTGGLKNELLGTTPSGRDVFFATHSRLVGQDVDGQGDLYDARIGGGFPPPSVPSAECDGDACLTPVSAPIDTTPASLSFSGIGNFAPATKAKAVKAKVVKPKVKPCKKGYVRSKGKCVRVKSKGARRSTRSHGSAIRHHRGAK